MSEFIPYGKHDISEADIQAVVDVLRSDYITQGPLVPEFEKALAEYTGARFGVAVNSATSALHIACLALGVGPGDVVWTSPITFVASANCALYCGANVNFLDIDPCTYNMSPESLREKLALAREKKCLPKVVIPVHLAGQSCQMKEIYELSKEFGFSIIEDASHAIGGEYLGKPVGSCEYSDITVFSFHPVKIMTSAEGGMAMTNDMDLATKMGRLRTHGVTRDPELLEGHDGPWYYEQIELGFNYRMTDLQAGLGLSQLTRLDEFVAKRRAKAKYYSDCLEGSSFVTPSVINESSSAWHLYIIRASHRSSVYTDMIKSLVGVNVHYIPVYHQPYFKSLKTEFYECNHAEKYYHEALTLPLYPNLTQADQDKVVEILLKCEK